MVLACLIFSFEFSLLGTPGHTPTNICFSHHFSPYMASPQSNIVFSHFAQRHLLSPFNKILCLSLSLCKTKQWQVKNVLCCYFYMFYIIFSSDFYLYKGNKRHLPYMQMSQEKFVKLHNYFLILLIILLTVLLINLSVLSILQLFIPLLYSIVSKPFHLFHSVSKVFPPFLPLAFCTANPSLVLWLISSLVILTLIYKLLTKTDYTIIRGSI